LNSSRFSSGSRQKAPVQAVAEVVLGGDGFAGFGDGTSGEEIESLKTALLADLL
jgi:hypothetical protein